MGLILNHILTGSSSSTIGVTGSLEVMGDVLPSADDTYALGSASKRWASVYLGNAESLDFNNGDVKLTHDTGKVTWEGDGTVEIDFNNHEMTNVDIDNGTIDNTVIGGATPAAATVTALIANDSLVVNANASIIGDTASEVQLNVAAHASQATSIFNVELQDGTDKLTVSSAGVTTAASLVATTADINGGTADGVIIGNATPAAAIFTTATAATVKATTLQSIDGYAAGSIAAGSGVVTLPSSVLTTADINGGTIDGSTIATSDVTVGAGKTLDVSAGTLTTSAAQKEAIMEGAGANIDIGAYDLRAATLTADGLTSARVVFAGTNGVLSDDSDMTFSGDTLTVTKLGAFEAAGAIDFSDENMTNVDIDSGAIDGTVIGAVSAAAGTFAAIVGTTLNATGATNLSGSLGVGGAADFDSTLNADGAVTFGSTLGCGAITASGTSVLAALTVSGDLLVSGDTVTVNVSDLQVEDKQIELNHPATGEAGRVSNVGAGLLLSGSTAANDIIWSALSDGGRMQLSNDMGVANGKAFFVNTNNVLNQTTLGGTVLASSLTSLGTVASLVATTADINAGTIDNSVIGGVTPNLGTFTTATASIVKVATLQAGDGTAAGSIAGSTGVVTLASAVLTTADINGGTADAIVIGGATPAAATMTTLTATTSNLGTLGSNVDHGNYNSTNVDIDSGAIDGTIIGAATPAAATVTTLNATTSNLGALGSNVDHGNFNSTNVDIDSGAIDGTIIGAATPAAATMTTLNATGATNLSGSLGVGGAADFDSTLHAGGAVTFGSTLGVGGTLGVMGVTTFAAGVVPAADNSIDLGASGYRFRNIYTGDLHLANERGNWTLVEESNMLTFRNNLSGKWFRMVMEEIDGDGRNAGMNGPPPLGGIEV
jgi:hypothetical protein